MGQHLLLRTTVIGCERALLRSALDFGGGAEFDFVDQGEGALTFERLGVEQFVVAEWDRVLGQGDHLS